MGCWVLTQADAAITKEEGRLTVLIMVFSLAFFALTLGTSAFLAKRAQGFHAIVRRMLFLVGLFGSLVVLFFVATSRGKIFLFSPLPSILLSLFVLSALFFRPRKTALLEYQR